MMEPDVRQDTNRLGFCFTHYQQLMMQNNRLSLGLMLNSHLEELRGNIFEKKGLFAPKDAKAKKAGAIGDTCFVCSKVQWGIDHMLNVRKGRKVQESVQVAGMLLHASLPLSCTDERSKDGKKR